MFDKYTHMQPYARYSMVISKEYAISELPFEEWPEIVPLTAAKCVEHFESKKYVYDENGVVIFNKDGHVYYKPVFVTQAGLNALRAYVESKKIQYLNIAETQAQALVNNATRYKNSLQFPYNFDFPLHGKPGEENLMKAPWYSGMAQGQVLSLFSALFYLTKKSEYLDWSYQIFNGFFKRSDGYDIWLVYMDELGFTWIEEYPQNHFPCNTLNGKIFAIFGLFNFYMTTKNNDAYNLLQESLRTVEFYMPQFRKKGDVSYYDLKYKQPIKSYHKVHCRQLLVLYKITGDSFYLDYSKKLLKDFWWSIFPE